MGSHIEKGNTRIPLKNEYHVRSEYLIPMAMMSMSVVHPTIDTWIPY